MLILAIIIFAADCLFLAALLIQQQQVNQRIITMAENQTELAAEIRDFKATVRTATDQVLKATAEVAAKIIRLEALIAAGGPITQEVKDAMADLKTSGASLAIATQAADDVVPDAPV